MRTSHTALLLRAATTNNTSHKTNKKDPLPAPRPAATPCSTRLATPKTHDNPHTEPGTTLPSPHAHYGGKHCANPSSKNLTTSKHSAQQSQPQTNQYKPINTPTTPQNPQTIQTTKPIRSQSAICTAKKARRMEIWREFGLLWNGVKRNKKSAPRYRAQIWAVPTPMTKARRVTYGLW